MEGALRENRHRLQTHDIFGAARRVNLSRGDHRGDATVKTAVDPAQLVLAGRPIAADGMHVAVDQAGRERSAFGIDRCARARSVDVLLFAHGLNNAVDGDDRVGVENGAVEVSAEEESDVADH